MAWFRKKGDPISDRARALNEEIAALEAQIKKLDGRLQDNHAQPRLRSTALPHGSTVNHAAQPGPPSTPVSKSHEPIFEEVDRNRLKTQEETDAAAAEQQNDLGVRKHGLASMLRRLRGHFRGPPTNNPKLVSYLAAGGIQGLRPMRYEKRVARNRFIALVVILFFTLLGIILVFSRHPTKVWK